MQRLEHGSRHSCDSTASSASDRSDHGGKVTTSMQSPRLPTLGVCISAPRHGALRVPVVSAAEGCATTFHGSSQMRSRWSSSPLQMDSLRIIRNRDEAVEAAGYILRPVLQLAEERESVSVLDGTLISSWSNIALTAIAYSRRHHSPHRSFEFDRNERDSTVLPARSGYNPSAAIDSVVEAATTIDRTACSSRLSATSRHLRDGFNYAGLTGEDIRAQCLFQTPSGGLCRTNDLHDRVCPRMSRSQDDSSGWDGTVAGLRLQATSRHLRDGLDCAGLTGEDIRAQCLFQTPSGGLCRTDDLHDRVCPRMSRSQDESSGWDGTACEILPRRDEAAQLELVARKLPLGEFVLDRVESTKAICPSSCPT